MAVDVTEHEPTVAVRARIHRRRGVVLGLLAAFQLWLWGTRIVNLLRDANEFSSAFVGVHLALYAAAIGAAVVLGVMGRNLMREAGRPGRR